MADPSPSGELNTDYLAIRTLLAGSAAFRTLVGAANVAAAEALIFDQCVGEDEALPEGAYALVIRGRGWTRESQTLAGDFQTTPVMDVTVVRPVADGDTHRGALRRLENEVGAIMVQVEALQGTTVGEVSYAFLESWQPEPESPRRGREDEVVDSDLASERDITWFTSTWTLTSRF